MNPIFHRYIPFLLIAIGIFCGIFGFYKLDINNRSVDLGNTEITTTKKSGTQEAYLLLALAGICMAGGTVSLKRRKKSLN